MKKLLFLTSWSLMLISCGTPTKQTPSPSPPIIPPPTYIEPEEQYNNPGSIYMNAESDGLFADTRARRVGDIVMVKIVENNTAKNKADTTSTSSRNNEYGLDAFFGKTSIGPSGKAHIPVGNPSFGTSSASNIATTGETNREGSISGTIAARVLKILPGGLLQIEGVRQTRINSETQYIVVTGLIRPIDIAPDNSITSNRISDAKIEYYGEGALSGKEKPGWFTRFVDAIWPF